MTNIEVAIDKYHRRWDGKLEGILIFQLATGTGYLCGEPNRIDAWFMAATPSKHLRRVAYEIKTSRSDFLQEVKDPRKRRFALGVSNQFYFVTPEGLLKPEEIPLECGLMEVDIYGRMYEEVKAPFRDGLPANWHFFASVGRQLLKIAAKDEEMKS